MVFSPFPSPRTVIAVCALAACVAASGARAAVPPPIEDFTLPNGLEVIVIPNHRVPAVSHMLWYRVGAADDPRGKSGLAHYHEHMMYEGTPAHKAGDYASTVARNGGEENAFTGEDATAYYIDIARDKLPLAMELEADRMMGLAPTNDGAAKEKEVIIEERRMRIGNNPEALLAEQMNAALFRNHPYHWPVIGWMNEMQGLTRDDVLAFHKTWYHPNNAILIISGDVTADEIKPLVKKYYGGLPRMAVPARRWTEEPPQNAARRVVLRHPNVKQPSWARSYATSSIAYGKKEEALPLFVLAQLLGGGKTSRLYRSLIVDQKIATGIDADYNGFTLGPAQFELTVIPERDVDPETVERAVDKELARLIDGGIAKDELARAKAQLKAESVYARDGLSSMARIMGQLRICGLDTSYFGRWPELIDAVTAEQVIAAAKETLKPEQSVTGILLPETAKEAK